MRRIKSLSAVPQSKEAITDPFLLATEFISISSEKEMVPIGPPRASSLYDCCLRKHVIGAKHGLSQERWMSVKERVTFGIGTAVHTWVQNTPELLGDNRYGWWKCRLCGEMYFGKVPSECHFCGSEHLEYVEQGGLITNPYQLSYHVDMLVKRHDRLRVLEIKTINGNDFATLAAPLAQHEFQMSTYVYALKNDESFPATIDETLGYILYISKKFEVKTLPMKMFPVQVQPHHFEKIEKRLATFERGIKEFPASLPAVCTQCHRHSWCNWEAKSCACKDLCIKYANVGIRK